MELPTQHELKLNYPRSASVHTVFSSQSVRKMLNGTMDPPLGALLQLYVATGHWRALIICFVEKRVYYHEPYGSVMLTSRAVTREFRTALQPHGWHFENIVNTVILKI